MLLVGALSLRVNRRKQLHPKKVAYGPGINVHMFQSGIEIEHGMVITKSKELKAQSKRSEAYLEAMLIK